MTANVTDMRQWSRRCQQSWWSARALRHRRQHSPAQAGLPIAIPVCSRERSGTQTGNRPHVSACDGTAPSWLRTDHHTRSDNRRCIKPRPMRKAASRFVTRARPIRADRRLERTGVDLLVREAESRNGNQARRLEADEGIARLSLSAFICVHRRFRMSASSASFPFPRSSSPSRAWRR